MQGMDYNKWLRDLEAFLRSRRPDINLADLDPNAMHKAFSEGDSPFVFGSRTALPLRPISNPQPYHPVPAPHHPQQQIYHQNSPQTLIATISCPKCGTLGMSTVPFCQHCGSKLRAGGGSDGTVYGVIALVAAGMGLFMCQVLVPFFILTSIAFAAFAFHKGAKGLAVASFILCFFLLAFFIYTMGQIQSGLDDLRRGLPSR